MNKKPLEVVNSACESMVLPVWPVKSDWSVKPQWFWLQDSRKVCHRSLVGVDPSIISQISQFDFRLLVRLVCEQAPGEDGKNSAGAKQKNERNDEGGTGKPVDFAFDVPFRP